MPEGASPAVSGCRRRKPCRLGPCAPAGTRRPALDRAGRCVAPMGGLAAGQSAVGRGGRCVLGPATVSRPCSPRVSSCPWKGSPRPPQANADRPTTASLFGSCSISPARRTMRQPPVCCFASCSPVAAAAVGLRDAAERGGDGSAVGGGEAAHEGVLRAVHARWAARCSLRPSSVRRTTFVRRSRSEPSRVRRPAPSRRSRRVIILLFS